MKLIPSIVEEAPEFVRIRRDLHSHPEIGFQEERTSALVAELLRKWGMEVTRGIGRTGVVGVLRGSRPGPTTGLRADMDALPIQTTLTHDWASRTPGVFHGCGHDGHTAALLLTARHLSRERDFPGTCVFIFQPAEEGRGGARAMLKDGLFEKFPCDRLYGWHNWPGLEPGVAFVAPGRHCCRKAA